jgi:hypothetical protein
MVGNETWKDRLWQWIANHLPKQLVHRVLLRVDALAAGRDQRMSFWDTAFYAYDHWDEEGDGDL